MSTRWMLPVCACVAFQVTLFTNGALAQGAFYWDRTSQSSQAESSTTAFVYPGGTRDTDTDTSSTPQADAVSSGTSSACSGGGGSAEASGSGECELNTDCQDVFRWDFEHDLEFDITVLADGCADAGATQETETQAYATLQHSGTPPAETNARLYVNIEWDEGGDNCYLSSRDLNMTIRIGNEYLSLYVDGSGYLTAESYPNFYKQSTMTVYAETGSFEIDLTEFVTTVSVGSQAYIYCTDPVYSNLNYLFTSPDTIGRTAWFDGTIQIHVDN